jgi:Tol biopolymer transport system component
VFVAGRPAETRLFIVDLPTGTPRQLSEENSVLSVTTTRQQPALVFERRLVDANLWRVSGPSASRPEPPRALTSWPNVEMHPAYSPDGGQIAFSGKRLGCRTVWTCTADGRDCNAAADGCFRVPRWSPDGRSLAVGGWQPDRPDDVYRVEIGSRFVRRLTADSATDIAPSWSRDGRWLYFASNRTGSFEIWKMPSLGGEPRRLTTGGGSAAHETSDGHAIYFTNGYPRGRLWRMPADGGEATLVLDVPIQYLSWTLWRDRVIYVEDYPSVDTDTHVAMFDPGTSRKTRLASLMRGRVGPGLAVSPDGAWIVYPQTDHATSDILMLEGVK